jgi:hypothetical protein
MRGCSGYGGQIQALARHMAAVVSTLPTVNLPYCSRRVGIHPRTPCTPQWPVGRCTKANDRFSAVSARLVSHWQKLASPISRFTSTGCGPQRDTMRDPSLSNPHNALNPINPIHVQSARGLALDTSRRIDASLRKVPDPRLILRNTTLNTDDGHGGPFAARWRRDLSLVEFGRDLSRRQA